MQNNYFILTGAMGSGKSTLLKALAKQRLKCVDEPARKILAEQRSINGDAIPERDPKLFTHLLLSRSIYLYERMSNHTDPVIFDRGIPDNVAYANFLRLKPRPFINAANRYHYNKHVFFLPAWQDIYKTDDERKMNYEQSQKFGEDIYRIYQGLGYEIIEVTPDTVENRAAFVSDRITKLIKKKT